MWNRGCRVIAAVQMVGGTLGLAWLGWAVFSSGQSGVGPAVFAGLYLLGVVAGIVLWRHRPEGIGLSMLFQAVQLVSLKCASVAYAFVAGLVVELCFGTAGFDLGCAVGSSFRFRYTSGFGAAGEAAPWMVGINLLPAVFLIVLALAAVNDSKPRVYACRGTLPQDEGI